MKIRVDRDACIATGCCVSTAAEHFAIGDDGRLVVLNEDVTRDALADVRAAINGCPAAALRLERDSTH